MLVGGVAVVLHGHARLTLDVDLVVDLAPEAARTAVAALTGCGLRPLVPVDPAGFADPATRTAWVRERNMMVFTLTDPRQPMHVVDLFVDPPVPYADLAGRAVRIPLGSVAARVASIDDLIAMKRLAGRAKDAEDIAVLERIKRGG